MANSTNELMPIEVTAEPKGTLRYVLITPARNEAAYIEKTIESVLAQTMLPLRWVIVSDGSTDGTDDIVKKYAAKTPWLHLIRMPERRERHFAGKVYAFSAGYDAVKDLDFELIANLDGDTSFDPGYFAYLLKQFGQNARLGVAGTPFTEGSFQYDYRFTSIEHVSGQIQVFRRKCFDEIGGYKPLKTGGVDLTAVITARMKGWQTRTFVEKSFVHHRKMSTANSGTLAAAFKSGRVDYLLGCDPILHLVRSIYRLGKRRPILLDGTLGWAGYCWAVLRREKKVLPQEVVAFRRREERNRLRALLRKTLGLERGRVAGE